MSALTAALKEQAQQGISPAGEVYPKIDLKTVEELARRFHLSHREVEIAALEEGIIPERYQRSLGTVGVSGQVALLKSRAAVIGAGGLGGLVIELLARMGVGRLVVADGDVFSESNLNRQLLATEKNLGKNKAAEGAERVARLNSSVEVQVEPVMATSENLPAILDGCGVAFDCLDNLPSRRLLAKACRDLGIPLVHGAIAQYMGQVLTIFPEDPGFDVVYPYPEMERGIETVLGNPAATPAMIAAWQVQEGIKVLIGGEPLLRNRLLYFDMREGRTDILHLKDA